MFSIILFIFGFLLKGLFYIALIIGLIVCLVRTSRLRHRLSMLEAKLKEDSPSGIASPQPAAPPTHPQKVEEKPPTPETSLAKLGPVLYQATKRAPAKNKSDANRTESNTLRWLKKIFTANNIIAIIGALLLFVGVGALLEYAAHIGMLPMSARLILAVLLCVFLIGLGFYLRRRNPVFANILIGAGLGVAYIFAYAALSVFHVLPLVLAIILMIAITVCLVVIGILFDVYGLAFLGVVGAFAAPMLVFHIGNQVQFVLSYYLLVNIAVLCILYFRLWTSLAVAAFSITSSFLTYCLSGNATVHFAFFQTFLVMFFVLFQAMQLLLNIRHVKSSRKGIVASLLFSIPAWILGLQYMLLRYFGIHCPWGMLPYVGFYAVLTFSAYRSNVLKPVAQFYLCITIFILTIALLQLFSSQTLQYAWLLEGFGLTIIGMRERRILLITLGILTQWLAACAAWVFYGLGLIFTDPAVHINMIVTFLLIAISAFITSYYWQKNYPRAKSGWIISAIYAAMYWLLAGHSLCAYLSWPIWARIEPSLLGFAVCVLLAKPLRWPNLSDVIYALVPWFAIFFLGLLISQINTPWYALLINFSVVVSLLWYSDKRDPIMRCMHQVSVYLLLITIACIAYDALMPWYDQQKIALVWLYIVFGMATIIVATLVGYLARCQQVIARGIDNAYQIASVMLYILLAAVLVFLNTRFFQSFCPVNYWPILNPIDIFSMMVLFVIWRGREGIVSILPVSKTAFTRDYALIAFIWFSSLIIRSICYPMHQLNHWFFYAPMQVSLSIAWTIVALTMTLLANKSAQRFWWYSGVALLALTLAKLILVDLVATSNLLRIIVFMVVGGLFLAVGYFAPLPEKTNE